MKAGELIWKPHVTVAAVIERAGSFLLVQERIAGRLVYNQPAGHLEEGESLIDAVIRETLEETAWHFQPEMLVGLYRWRPSDKPETYLRITFTGSALRHEPERRLDPDVERALWMEPRTLRDPSTALRSPLVLRAVEDFLAGIRFPIELLADIE
jgi:ADP-ribose pyrophosphatase YjhB (NUDIX family)